MVQTAVIVRRNFFYTPFLIRQECGFPHFYEEFSFFFGTCLLTSLHSQKVYKRSTNSTLVSGEAVQPDLTFFSFPQFLFIHL